MAATFGELYRKAGKKVKRTRWMKTWRVLLCAVSVALAGTGLAYAEETAPGQTASDQAAAGQAAQDQTAAGQAAQEQAAPAQTAPTEPIQDVHTIYWRAKLRSDVKKNGVTVLHGGQWVVVVNRAYRRGKSVVQYDGGTVRVPNSNLFFSEDLCTTVKEGDYNRTTKLWYVNESRKLHSRTNYLIWVSLDKQRVNVFTRGAGGKWEIVKELKCSTGLPESPSKAGLHKCDFKALWFRGCNFYVEYGGSGIHKWVRSDYKDIHKLGKHTASQSCIRLVRRDAKWLYNTIPVNTTILVW